MFIAAAETGLAFKKGARNGGRVLAFIYLSVPCVAAVANDNY